MIIYIAVPNTLGTAQANSQSQGGIRDRSGQFQGHVTSSSLACANSAHIVMSLIWEKFTNYSFMDYKLWIYGFHRKSNYGNRKRIGTLIFEYFFKNFIFPKCFHSYFFSLFTTLFEFSFDTTHSCTSISNFVLILSPQVSSTTIFRWDPLIFIPFYPCQNMFK